MSSQPTATEHHVEAHVPAPVDVYENKDELLILADVPGARRDDVVVRIDKGKLTIEAPRSDQPTGRKLATEYEPHAYRRVFSVPDGIDAERVTAELADGTLRVRIPKSDAQKPRQIAVRAG